MQEANVLCFFVSTHCFVGFTNVFLFELLGKITLVENALAK